MASNSLVSRGVLQVPDCHGRPTCDPTPVCPACGGLECLCRPRFFAGQLLTEDDLNLLDQYLQGKNRLHNRHLHGWGVVCGLEVVCGVCGPNLGDIVVKPGYALSPCGNDIVVCRNETVDVCDLINRCRPPVDDCHDPFIPSRPGRPTPPVPPPGGGVPGTPGVPGQGERPTDCPGGEEQWVLAVCYVEKPARGMAALHAGVDTGCGCQPNSGCSCGCGSKGSGSHASHGSHGSHGTSASHGSGGGCGCGGGHKAGSDSRHGKSGRGPTRHVPETCEPTVICEGYRFVVYKAPKRKDDREYGAAARRFICCVLPFLEQLGAAKPGASPAEAAEWVASFYDTVYQFVVNEGLYDCVIAQKLGAIVIPTVTGQPTTEAMAKLNQASAAIGVIAYLVFQKCFCAALLPPCPEPAYSDCVPLATITVSRGECRVKRVCNVSARKFLVTFPNLEYWFSFITGASGTSIGSKLRAILERLCCSTDERISALFASANFFRAADQMQEAVAGATPAGHVAKDDNAFSVMLLQAMRDRQREAGAEHVLLGALDARDAQGGRFASDEELAHPTELIVAHKIVAPLLRSFVPATEITERLTAAVHGMTAGTDRVDSLEREITNLKKTVADQGKTIKALKHRR